MIDRIDQALHDIPELRSGIEPYGLWLAEHGVGLDEAPRALMKQAAVDVAADLHQERANATATLLEFSDGAYHRGFPARLGFDKGHAMAHAQGGREGGPNYFPQAPRVNRRLSPLGSLWRDIETYLARNPGLYCFVRLAYSPGLPSDVPVEVEYGLVAEGRFRAVIFPNA